MAEIAIFIILGCVGFAIRRHRMTPAMPQLIDIICVNRPPVDTGHVLHESRSGRLCGIGIYIRFLPNTWSRRVRKLTRQRQRRVNDSDVSTTATTTATRQQQQRVIERRHERHQTWACAAMVAPPARYSVAQIATYTTSWTIPPAHV